MRKPLTASLTTFALTWAAVILLVGTAALADEIDFSCSLNASNLCTGTITQSGSNYSTTGISVYNDSGPYNAAVPFTLAFDTLTSTISIDGTGVYSGQDLGGQILGFTYTNGQTTADLSFSAMWTTLPPAVQALLGSSTGIDSGFVITSLAGSAKSGDILITPVPDVPEPTSLALFGPGLLAIGVVLRRKLCAGSEPGSPSASTMRELGFRLPN